MKMPSPAATPLKAFCGRIGSTEMPLFPPWMNTPTVKTRMMTSSQMSATPRICAEILMSK
jgi:hypothetical protein